MTQGQRAHAGASPPGGDVARLDRDAAVDALNERCREWLVQIALGDEAAFTALYQATTARMWPLAMRVVGQSQAAEDVLADLYLQIWRSASSFDPTRSAALGWMTVMCRSRAIDHLRRRDPAESHDDIDAVADAAMLSDVAPEATHHDDDRLDAALRQLPGLRRQMLSLACFRGFSHSDLAAHFDLPLGTVKSHMRAAMAQVRHHLAVKVPS